MLKTAVGATTAAPQRRCGPRPIAPQGALQKLAMQRKTTPDRAAARRRVRLPCSKHRSGPTSPRRSRAPSRPTENALTRATARAREPGQPAHRPAAGRCREARRRGLHRAEGRRAEGTRRRRQGTQGDADRGLPRRGDDGDRLCRRLRRCGARCAPSRRSHAGGAVRLATVLVAPTIGHARPSRSGVADVRAAKAALGRRRRRWQLSPIITRWNRT